ncbi:MAG: PRC-barrel domain-containing protein [Bradyrhizobium sp.]|jgi:hypothetical protein|uniref:PRC-barrel domain-containing protein n=1 Tax=Bradyrhizobium TaxID=374 RepID=UPI001556567E|nr:PRC-barrel domain-containing protein [Bradyrhizobium sp. LMG 8443]NPU25266.1 PRC-barrel domain-containing protein [Bradyrhizobium sp. LMG 8443]
MKKLLSHFRLLVLVTNCLPYSYAVGQEVALTPVETAELARGYSGEALKRKTVVNEKGETLGRISDFIFGKDGNIYVVLAVGDLVSYHLVAIPFRSLKLENSSGSIVLSGINPSTLEKLPVYLPR